MAVIGLAVVDDNGPRLGVAAEGMQEDQSARGDHREHDGDGDDAAHARHYVAAAASGARA